MFLREREKARKKMEYSVRSGKHGFECEVCGRFVGDLKLSHFCRRCHKLICILCSTPHFFPTDLSPQFLRNRKIDKPSYVCPDCKEELGSEEIEVPVEEEDESPRQITECALCAATDEPPDQKTFGYSSPDFFNCERCGKLVCENCIRSATDMMHGYFYETLENNNMVCKECYEGLEKEYAARWEEEFGETSAGPNPYRDE
jgi:hypothetical protein